MVISPGKLSKWGSTGVHVDVDVGQLESALPGTLHAAASENKSRSFALTASDES